MLKIANNSNIIVSTVFTIVSLVVPSVLFYKSILTQAESFLIGASLFLVLQVYYISYNTSNVKNTVNNKTLRTIAEYYNKLDQDSQNKLFVEYYNGEFKILEDALRCTVNNQYITPLTSRLYVDDPLIYSAFDNKNTATFCATSTSAEIKAWCEYKGEFPLKNIHKRVENKKIKSVQRIFIYDKADITKDAESNEKISPLIQFCLTLHQNGNYAFKLIKKEDYDKYLMQRRASHNIVIESDFAIYGQKYVWETEYTGNDGFVERGRFSKNEKTVNNYQTFFNELWNDKNIKINSVDPYTIDGEIIELCKDKYITELANLYKRYVDKKMENKESK